MKHLFLFLSLQIALINLSHAQFNNHQNSFDCGTGQSAAKQSKSSGTIIKAFTSPYVIANNESFSMNLQVSDNTISQIEFSATAFWAIKQNGKDVTTLILKDDGTQGDLIANDLIFTTANITFANNTTYAEGWFMRYCNTTYTYKNATTLTESVDLACGIRRINTDVVQIPNTVIDDATFQHTTHTVNIVANGWSQQDNITKQYYSYFPDDRDFIFLATTYSTPNGPAADYQSIKMQDMGTHVGDNLYNSSFMYGSGDKLTGILRFYFTYGGQLNLMNHELLHQWASYLSYNMPLAIPGCHWGVVQFPRSGFGSGFQVSYINQLTDSTFRTGRDNNFSGTFNELELYLMGLLPIDSVTFPIKSIKNYSYLQYVNGETDYKGMLTSIDKSTFLANTTPRKPDFTQTQKLYKGAMIVISDRLLSNKEMAYYDYLMKANEKGTQTPEEYSNLGPNFKTASGGRASLETVLPIITAINKNTTNKSIELYPNPAKDYIKLNGISTNADIEIYSLTGELLIQQKNVGASKINISELSQGVYFATVKVGGVSVVSRRIVKM